MKIVRDFVFENHLWYIHQWESGGVRHTVASCVFRPDECKEAKHAIYRDFLTMVENKKRAIAIDAQHQWA